MDMLEQAQKALRKKRSIEREVKKETTRSPRWPAARDKYLKKVGKCEACGSTVDLQVHHVKPFHLHPDLELDPTNFISLCMDTNECHLNIGHGDSFKAYNPNVREDAAKFLTASSDDRKLIVESAKKNRLV
jgi:5-methylcytosine-specific restriction endonuclease McrA